MGDAKKNLLVRQRRVERAHESGFSYSTTFLADQLRRDAPGAWTGPRLEQSNHYRGVAYIAIKAIMNAVISCTIQINKKHRKYATTSLLMQEKAMPASGLGNEPDRLRPFDDPDHSLVKLIEQPNRTDTFNSLLAQMVMQRSLTGSALLWANPARTGLPGELYVLPTALCYAQPPTGEYPEGWWRVTQYYPSGGYGMLPSPIAGGGVPLDARDVFVFKEPHPLWRWDAYSPLTAGSVQLDLLEAIDQSRWSAMEQGLTPDMVLLAPGVQQSQLDTYLERLKQTNIGKRNYRKVMAIGGDQGDSKFDVKFPSIAAKDMDFSSGWDQMAAYALGLFGVPKSVAGLATTGSYAELYAALKQFHTLTLKPLVSQMAVWLTRHLCHDCWQDRTLAIQLDLPSIDDEQLQEQQFGVDLAHDLLTYNQALAKRGYKPVPGGDVIVSVYVANQQAKAQQQQQAAAQPQPQPGAPSAAQQPASPATSSPNESASAPAGGGAGAQPQPAAAGGAPPGAAPAPAAPADDGGDPLAALLGTSQPQQDASGDEGHVQNAVTDAAMAALGVPNLRGGTVQKGYEVTYLKANGAASNKSVPQTTIKPTKPGTKAVTAPAVPKSEASTQEPGSQYAGQSGQPRQQTQSDTSAPESAPTPAPNPSASKPASVPTSPTPKAAAPTAPQQPTPEPATPTAPTGAPDPGPKQKRNVGDKFQGPSGHWFEERATGPVPTGNPNAANQTATPQQPAAEPLPIPKPGDAGVPVAKVPIPARPTAIPVAPTQPPKVVNGRVQPPIHRGLVRGFHNSYTPEELQTAFDKLRGNSPVLRVRIPEPQNALQRYALMRSGKRVGDTVDISSVDQLKEHLDAGGLLPKSAVGRLQPDTHDVNAVNPVGGRATPLSTLSVPDLIDRGRHDKLTPEQLDAAAQAILGGKSVTRIRTNNGEVTVRTGADLKRALANGGRLRDTQRHNLESVRTQQQPAPGQPVSNGKPTDVSALINALSTNDNFRQSVGAANLDPQKLAANLAKKSPEEIHRYATRVGITNEPFAPAGGTQAPVPVADIKPSVTPEEVKAAVESGDQLPKEAFTEAAQSVPSASNPAVKAALDSATRWASAQADKRAQQVADHFKITTDQAHALLTHAILAVAGHAAKGNANASATVRNKLTGQKLNVALPSSDPKKNLRAVQAVTELSQHLAGGHEMSAENAAAFAHHLDNLRPDQLRRFANSAKLSMSDHEKSEVNDLIKAATQAAPEPAKPPTQADSDAVQQSAISSPNESAPAPGVPPVPKDHVRLYHGGSDPTSGGSRWITPDPEYARNFRRSEDSPKEVHYVDVHQDHPLIKSRLDDTEWEFGTRDPKYLSHFEVPADIASGFKPLPSEDEPPAPGEPPGKPSGEPAAKDGATATLSDGRPVSFVPHKWAEPGKQVTVWVDPSKLDSELAKYPTSHVPTDGSNDVGDRRSDFKKFLATGEPVQQPYATVNKGRISLKDGRHRFSMLHGAGIDRIPVTVSAGREARELQARVGASDQPAATQPVANHDAVTKLTSAVDQSPLPEDHKVQYRKAIDHVTGRLPKTSLDTIHKNVSKVTFSESNADAAKAASESIVSALKGKLDRGEIDQSTLDAWSSVAGRLLWEPHKFGGMFNEHDGGLFLTPGRAGGDEFAGRHGSTGKVTANDVMAHELGHAIDGPNFEISNSPEWEKAWDDEIVGRYGGPFKRSNVPTDYEHPLTMYAATRPAEGVAEFARLLYSSGVPHEKIEKDFPQASAVFKARGLWPDRKPGGTEPKMPDVFGERVSIGDDGSHVDKLKGGSAELSSPNESPHLPQRRPATGPTRPDPRPTPEAALKLAIDEHAADPTHRTSNEKSRLISSVLNMEEKPFVKMVRALTGDKSVKTKTAGIHALRRALGTAPENKPPEPEPNNAEG